ncbi:hypothetical protein FB446DRAFT_396331 [Lentinula raphanica]|nr:hypothetical protein FB446DRAFT_396331 [Lentinula raphanica]
MKNTNLKRPFQLAKDVFGSANKNMASHEELSYQDTKSFLLAHRDIRIAKLGYTCLELNEGDQSRGRRSSLPLGSPSSSRRCYKVTFLLDCCILPTALSRIRPIEDLGQLRCRTTGNVSRTGFCNVARMVLIFHVRYETRALQRVVSFLQNLVHFLSVNRLNQAINTQAKDLLDDLKKLIVLTLDEIPIDQHALDLFRSG